MTTMTIPGPAGRPRKGILCFSGGWKRNKQGVKVPAEVSVIWAVWAHYKKSCDRHNNSASQVLNYLFAFCLAKKLKETALIMISD